MRSYLVVANRTLGGEHLIEKVKECLAGGPCLFHIVVPVTLPGGHTWTEGEVRDVAEQRLQTALARFRELGAEAEGEIGDSNPLIAIEDAVRGRSIDEIILSTLPGAVALAEARPPAPGGCPVLGPGHPPGR